MEPIGKLDQHDFVDIFDQKQGYQRKEVKTGPAFGIDVSVVHLPGDLAMALTSDPLSLLPGLGLEESAWLSVYLMANDMATTGLPPMYAQFVLNLPPGLSKNDFKTYWNHIHLFCSKIGVAVTGGHTGRIEGQNSTIAGGGTFITVAQKDKILVSSNAKPGNIILMTKECALSSTAILARSFPKTVKSKLGKEIYQDSLKMFYQTSSLEDGLVAAELNQDVPSVIAMHDVTEGGVLGAVYEMAQGSGNGVLIDIDNIPLGICQQKICELFSLDPAYCIGAGSMIIAAEKGTEKSIIEALSRKNISCTAIGEFVEPGTGMYTRNKEGNLSKLTYPGRDPYWEAFFNALKNNWK